MVDDLVVFFGVSGIIEVLLFGFIVFFLPKSILTITRRTMPLLALFPRYNLPTRSTILAQKQTSRGALGGILIIILLLLVLRGIAVNYSGLRYSCACVSWYIGVSGCG